MPGCPHDYPTWIIPVPEDVPVHEVEVRALDERDGHLIELESTLEVGRDTDDPAALLNQPFGVAVGDDGRIFVLSNGDQRIQVYDAEGRHLENLGRRGEGPGEFLMAVNIVRAGDGLAVLDLGNTKLGLWSLDGEVLDEPPLPSPSLMDLVGLASGRLLVGESVVDADAEPPRRERFLSALPTDGSATERLIELPQYGESHLVAPDPSASYAAAPSGRIWVLPGAEYQVHAYDVDGRMLWALRAPWERTPLTRDIIDGVRPYLETLPGDQREVDWPELLPAVREGFVDGHGHLYVFPYVYYNQVGLMGAFGGMEAVVEPDPAPETLPVDVYSAEGELLFSGEIETAGAHWMYWHDAMGDQVYRLTLDAETGEQFLQRLRLVEPF